MPRFVCQPQLSRLQYDDREKMGRGGAKDKVNGMLDMSRGWQSGRFSENEYKMRPKGPIYNKYEGEKPKGPKHYPRR